MSCLDVMYQVYGHPQPFFTAAYGPYHPQKLALYPKMQEAQESVGTSGHFSSHPAPAIKEEEECARARDKERPPEAEYLNPRCVLFTYFEGDIGSVVDEHFSRALSQPGGASGKQARDGTFPMSQRSFPPSFWNSAYQPSVSTSLGSSLSSTLGSGHTDMPFPADPYSTASLHSHLHQAPPEPWHPAHHHHHHHHHHPYSLGGAIGTQSSAYPRPGMHEVYGTHFDPRYSSLLVPSVRPHRLGPSGAPAPGTPQCDISKSDTSGSAWTGPFPGTGSDISQSLGLSMDTGLPAQDKSKDMYWF